jgi:biopolymer transport protein TolR
VARGLDPKNLRRISHGFRGKTVPASAGRYQEKRPSEAEPLDGLRRSLARARPSADPNVTPPIDILLVVLIIFMTTVRLSQQGLDVNVPVTEKRQPSVATQILLEYGADRRITINTQPVELHGLEGRLREIFRQRDDRTLFVRGDGALRYGEVVAVIDAAKAAGVTRVGVVTDGALARQK